MSELIYSLRAWSVSVHAIYHYLHCQWLLTAIALDGKGEGFGNNLSIQTVDIVLSAISTGRVCKFSEHSTFWPVCHILDTVGLYSLLVHKMLLREDLDHGKRGFYLASSGIIAWDDVYSHIAASLAQRGVIQDLDLCLVDGEALAKMAHALGVDKASVPGKISGKYV